MSDNKHASAWIAYEIGRLAHGLGKGDSDIILQAIGSIRDQLDEIEATQPAQDARTYEQMRLDFKARRAAKASAKESAGAS